MIVEICQAIIICIPIIFIGFTKSRKTAERLWKYIPPIQYTIIPSRHEKPGKLIMRVPCSEWRGLEHTATIIMSVKKTLNTLIKLWAAK